MPVIHLITRVETVFGVLDDKGNVIRQVPARAEITKFDDESFIEARDLIAAEREKIKDASSGQNS